MRESLLHGRMRLSLCNSNLNCFRFRTTAPFNTACCHCTSVTRTPISLELFSDSCTADFQVCVCHSARCWSFCVCYSDSKVSLQVSVVGQTYHGTSFLTPGQTRSSTCPPLVLIFWTPRSMSRANLGWRVVRLPESCPDISQSIHGHAPPWRRWPSIWPWSASD